MNLSLMYKHVIYYSLLLIFAWYTNMPFIIKIIFLKIIIFMIIIIFAWCAIMLFIIIEIIIRIIIFIINICLLYNCYAIWWSILLLVTILIIFIIDLWLIYHFYVISVFVYVDRIFWPKFREEWDCNIYGFHMFNRYVRIYIAWSASLSLSAVNTWLQWSFNCFMSLSPHPCTVSV